MGRDSISREMFPRIITALHVDHGEGDFNIDRRGDPLYDAFPAHWISPYL
jgi:hypothetical protein